jgi:hypothetical protein
MDEIIAKFNSNIMSVSEDYENYTLLELIELVHITQNDITCPFNKRAIIKMIKDKKLDIPRKTGPMHPTQWQHQNLRTTLDIIQTVVCDFYEGCLIQLEDGNIYRIDVCEERRLIDGNTEDVLYVYLFKYVPGLEEQMNEYEARMTADRFIHMIDNDDITLLQIGDLDYHMSEDKMLWT